MTAEPELSLISLDRLLRPVRRTLSFAARSPGSVRFVEDNLGRWVQELLTVPLPEALREDVVVLAGQLSGFDASEDQELRIQHMRGAVLHLDEVLGLPLPPRRMRALRKRNQLIKQPDEPSRTKTGTNRAGRSHDAGSGEEDRDPKRADPKRADAKGADLKGADGDESREKGRGRRARDRKPKKGTAERVPRAGGNERSSRDARPRGWNGDLAASIGVLGLPDTLQTRLLAAGLKTVGSLLFLQPHGTEVIKIQGAGRELDEGRVAVGGRRAVAWTRVRPDGTRVTEATLRGAGDVRLLWMDTERAERWLARVGPGERTVVVGAWDGDAMLEPLAVRSDGKQVRLGQYGVDGVDDEEIQLALSRVFPRMDRMRDPLPPAYRAGKPTLAEALTAIHGSGDLERARDRLAFDESMISALVAGVTALGKEKPRGIQHNVLHTAAARVLSAADAQLDDAQELVFDRVKRDLRSSRPMRRVVFGEPGGGKGLVSLCAAATVAESKCQVAILSSDPVLTEQRYAFAEPLLSVADLTCSKLDRIDATAREALKKGQINVVFGGPELLDPQLEYRRLGLVIVDDDDGSITEALLQRPSPMPDVLVVPMGTPSVAQIVAGWPGYSMSYLRGLERPNVLVKPANQRVSAYAQARHALLDNGQVAVLFPLIENRDALDPTEASRVMKALSTDALPGAKLALYHGAMPREDRVKTFQDFRHRRSDALLATTALEESAPVPGLQVAVVEHAHKMSPARLSRLAGLGIRHVSLVVAEGTPEEQIEELRKLVSDGWSAPFTGEGLPKLSHVDLEHAAPEQLEILVHARNLAMRILSQDRQLRSGSHLELLRLARERWSAWFGERPCPLPEPSEEGQRRRRKRRRRR